jgi:hypothetical protein
MIAEKINEKPKMKHILVLIILSTLIISSCDFLEQEGSGRIVTRNYDFSRFTGIGAHSGLDFTVKQDDFYEVRVRVDDNLVDELEVYQSRKDISIGFEGITPVDPTEFSSDIVTDEITAFDISGGSHGTFYGFDNISDLYIEISGGSKLTAGSSQNVDGRFELDSSGGSKLYLQDLTVTDPKIDMSGGSVCRIRITDNSIITGHLSGGSTLYHCGRGIRDKTSKSGGSTVKRVDCDDL